MFVCSICKRDFIPQSLKLVENQQYPKCDECFYAKKAQSSLASANRKAQTEMMRLERRIEKLEKTNEMLETIIESMVAEKVSASFSDTMRSLENLGAEAQIQKLEAQITKLQGQIVAVNNKVIEIRGFRKPDEKVE